MGVEKNLTETTRLHKNTHTVDLYRPPALRNHLKEPLVTNNTNSTNTTTNNTTTPTTTTTSTSTSTSQNTSTNTSATTITSSTVSLTTADIQTTTSKFCTTLLPIHANENSINNFENQTNNAINEDKRDITTSATIEATTAATTTATTATMTAINFNEQQRQTKSTRRERRPDRAVYIPRARRSQTTPPTTITTIATTNGTTETSAITTINLSDCNNINKSQHQQQLPITLNKTNALTVTNTTSTKADELLANNGKSISTSLSTIKKLKSNNSSNSSSSSSSNNTGIIGSGSGSGSGISSSNSNSNSKEQRKERVKKSKIGLNIKSDANLNKQILQVTEEELETVEESFVNASSNDMLCENSKLIDEINCDSADQKPIKTTTTTTTTPTTTTIYSNTYTHNNSPSEYFNYSTQNINQEIYDNDNDNEIMNTNNKNKTVTTTTPTTKITTKKRNNYLGCGVNATNLRIEDVRTKCDNDEEQELQRASKEINRSNRRIMKQTFVSDILEIPEKIEEDNGIILQKLSNSTVNNKTTSNNLATSPASTLENTTEEEEDEEDDWEHMYDESGDCLDPKIIQELTASVGKVKIELPKMDYNVYLTKQSILNEEEFPHVLEVSNFPVEFKNQDLLMIFSAYKESGFDIKWVDDTHALAVFSSPRVAAEVLTLGHPFVVLKPLAEATIESRLKAKKCAASLQPYRQRPVTCAALARRLVTGALGVRLKTAVEEREIEKRVLREAKERKLLAAKQRDEVWES